MLRSFAHHPRAAVATTAVILSMGIGVLLAGCTPDQHPEPSSSPSSTAAATPSAVATEVAPVAPVLIPDGTAADNLPLFSGVTASVWATPENVAGRSYIDALVAAGFDKTAMQVTSDQTTVGNAAESIQFSVRWGDECLVGQVGPATGAPVTAVLPGLTDGACLLGQTRAIDW